MASALAPAYGYLRSAFVHRYHRDVRLGDEDLIAASEALLGPHAHLDSDGGVPDVQGLREEGHAVANLHRSAENDPVHGHGDQSPGMMLVGADRGGEVDLGE